MKIAIDKNSLKSYKKDGNEYIYLFDNEKLNELPDMHCINYRYCDFVNKNLTSYDVYCTDKNKANYKIGIIVPNYNYEHTIEKCLKSILNQTYQNFEIIVVDDMSTDDSIKIVNQLNSTKIKLIQLKQKRYNGGARNEAYLHLSDNVDYVYYVDSDDMVSNDYVETLLKTINERSEDVIFFDWKDMHTNKIVHHPTNIAFWKAIYKREITPRLRDGWKYSYDVPFQEDLSKIKHTSCYLDKVLYIYNSNRPGSLTLEKAEIIKRGKK